jgi:hypothetical protein
MLEEIIQQIEARGLFWAVERSAIGDYTAIVETTSNYVGDGLAGPGAHGGSTPAEALKSALDAYRP